MNTEYGLIISSELLKEKSSDGSYVFSGLTETQFSSIKEKSGIETALTELSNKINHNLSLTENIIEFLPKLNISHYRISNSIFSLISDFSRKDRIKLQDLPDFLKIETRIRALGFLARQNGISLSVHPQSSLSLLSEDDLDNFIEELDFHSWFFEAAGFPANFSNPIIIEPNLEPNSNNHEGAINFIKTFYTNFQKLKEETKSRVVIKNSESGFWNAVNLFKYFHVYLQEKFNNGLALSFDNYADQVNLSGSFDSSGKEVVENYIHIGAFHETWKGAVPIFLWSERSSTNSKITSEYLKEAIPDFNYNIKWECDVREKG